MDTIQRSYTRKGTLADNNSPLPLIPEFIGLKCNDVFSRHYLRGVAVDEGLDGLPVVTAGPGEGVTKPISSVPLFSEFFNYAKPHVDYWISGLYLAGVAAAQLRWHLSNINVIQII